MEPLCVRHGAKGFTFIISSILIMITPILKKTGTERVSNLLKASHVVKLELDFRAGQVNLSPHLKYDAMLPPGNHHKGAPCPHPRLLKGDAFYFSTPRRFQVGHNSYILISLIFLLSKCQGSFSIGRFRINANVFTSISHCISSSKNTKHPLKEATVLWIKWHLIVETGFIFLGQ